MDLDAYGLTEEMLNFVSLHDVITDLRAFDFRIPQE